ncbi:lipopolysaccharide biosynthesis protein [Candidatus Chloroploca sp. M-50]|uniref:Lipopolysaccharide biosynthesis protein n=1 Tax=Candidatus Chloroploca mongolica TaxID=2528176 RepID=A0ABS4D535_9CHLR|nr:Wzz/FepE/Etk N-terminal domain-containing protein [Candidatus Chloroploca mongolica]MBP1464551.1 lipopolysaccharide biosynthesis protein [Candidatus Chloroploca mongolica]NCC35558.1 lipopolysaccharide biosynthesis protein [Chloroflexia bacterium]
MQLRDYGLVLAKRWWVIVLTLVAAAVAAYGVSKLIPQTFRSQAVYLALANQADNGLNIVLRNSMNSYRELVMQPDVLDQISQEIGLDISGERWMRDVNIQPRPDEQKIIIEVDAPTLDQSMAMADAVGNRLVAEVNRINATLEGTARINVQRIQQARLTAIQPNTRINVLAGALLGLMLGVLLAYVLEYLDDTLKSSSDVERFVGLTTLGAIPTVEP